MWVLIIAFFGKITFRADDEDFTVDAWLASGITVRYSDVKNASLTNEIEYGVRKSGMETGRVCAGTFENSKYGKYSLYVYKSVEKYVAVISDEGVIVFNCPTEEKTEQAFYEIMKRAEENKRPPEADN